MTAFLTTSFELENAAVAIFYVTVDSYFGCFIATALEYSQYEVRGFVVGIILTFGYLGSIYQTLTFNSLVDVFTDVDEVSTIFLCCNYLAALTAFTVLNKCKAASKRYSTL